MARGVHDARDAGRQGGLEDALGADDVGLQQHVEGRVDRVGGEVHDRIDPGGRLGHRLRVRDVGRDDLLPLPCGLLGRHVEQPQQLVPAAQPFAQVAADRAGAPGDQHPHQSSPAAYWTSDSSTSHSTGA
jgi:hypothetical protein